jgi:hypothetical protein
VDRLAIWRGVEEWRAEAARIDLDADRVAATGTQIGDDPKPYRLDYELETGKGYVTRSLRIEARGTDWGGSLDLRRDDGGRWSVDPEGLADALDCDLGFSPLTNLMPILRHGLHREAGSEEFTMAWVSVPELTIHVARQRYTHLRPGLVRFESLDGQFAGFTADLELDDDGLILRYPELAERV